MQHTAVVKEKVKSLNKNLRLYNNFGGWTITKNGKLFFQEVEGVEVAKSKQLKEIDELIKDDLNNDWKAVLSRPLKGEIYQRHENGRWEFIEFTNGFLEENGNNN